MQNHWPAIYRKFLVALTAALLILFTAVSDGAVTLSEWIMVALSVLGALGVERVPNAPKFDTPTPEQGWDV